MNKDITVRSNSLSLFKLFRLLKNNDNCNYKFISCDLSSEYLVELLNKYKIKNLDHIKKIFPNRRSKEILFNPLNDFLSNNEKKIMRNTFNEILTTGQFTSGEYLEKISKLIKKFVKHDYVIPTSSGTDAIIIALTTLGIKKNDYVVIPPNSFAATENAIFAIGAKPILFDTNDDYCLDIFSNKLNKKIKAAIFVDLYGKNSLNEKIYKFCKKNKIKIIQDSAQSFGLSGIGKFADAVCLSFNPYKNFAAGGKAGAVTFRKFSETKFAKRFYYHGFEIGKKDYKVLDYGLNMRMDNLQAAILYNKIRFFGFNNFKRLIVAFEYSNFFKKNNLDYILNYPEINADHTWHQYSLQVKDPIKLTKFLNKNYNINLGKMYKYLTTDQNNNFSKSINKNSLVNTIKMHRRMVNLPIHNGISFEEIGSVINALKKYRA